MDSADVRVIQEGSRARLPMESLDCLGHENFLRDELQGDVAPEASVLGLVNHAHPALAEQLDDAIMGERFS